MNFIAKLMLKAKPGIKQVSQQLAQAHRYALLDAEEELEYVTMLVKYHKACIERLSKENQ